MADKKKTELSIILRTVDKATAGLKAINGRLEAMTKPIRDFKSALGDLRETSGIGSVVDGFKGVGSAIGDLLGKTLLLGGAIAAAVAGLEKLIEHYEDLGDKAERFGVSVDFLAQLRYAAKKSGSSFDALDNSLQMFSENLGQARAGTGRMAKFLGLVSPALLKQLKAAKSNEEAFLLLSDAMAKVEDPAKRAALAVKTGIDPSLAPLLNKGSKAIATLRERYASLAGSQQGAVDAAESTRDSLKDLEATSDGLKAALVEGLAPALKVIVQQLQEWLQGHRADIREWAAWLGARLPGAVNELVARVRSAVAWVADFVDKIGGWKAVAVGLVAVILGPLIGAIGSLGVALLSTPVGWAVGAIAAVVALKEAWDNVSDSVKEYLSFGPLVERMNKLIAGPDAAKEATNNIVANFASNQSDELRSFFEGVNTGKDKVTGGNSAFYSAVDAALARRDTHAKVTVDIKNAPPGTRVATDPQSTADVDTNLGLNLWGLP